ncbi:hypothetical protein PG984_012928 [Apiospora sp. TS-2023a]
MRADMGPNINSAISSTHCLLFTSEALTKVSETYDFIIDSGYASYDHDKLLGDYPDDDTMEAMGDCVDGRCYYLTYPNGEVNKRE